MSYDPYDGSGDLHDPDLMTLTQAAKFLRVRPTDLMSAVREGEIPVHQAGQRFWFSRAEVIQAMRNARRREHESDEDR
jgi:excisionase family DNA binding protein